MKEQLDLAPVEALPDNGVSLFERLVRDEHVDVAKMERFFALHERIRAHNAETAFNTAFVQMQGKIPTIGERARTDKTAYAPLEDIIDTVRPILTAHGFTLSFETHWPDGKVHVVGILTHLGGHSRRSEFLSAADTTGSKNAIQALGSAVQYGKRYTTKDLLCIVTREARDDDGESSEAAREPAEPAGLDEWWTDLTAVADEGLEAFATMWNGAKDNNRTKVFRTWVTKYRNGAVTTLKRHAATRNAAKGSDRG